MTYSSRYLPAKESGLLLRTARTLALSNSLTALLLTLTSMIWWISDVGYVGHAVPNIFSMKFNTAAALMLLAMAELLRLYANGNGRGLPHHVERKLAAQVANGLAAVVAVFSLATLAEYVFDINLGVDELLTHDYYATQLNPLVHPGRPMPLAAICLLFLALALIGWEWKPLVWLRQMLVLVPFTICMVVLFGLLNGTRELTVSQGHFILAWIAAVVILLLSAALLCLMPKAGYMELFWSKSHAGRVLRVMAPGALLLPGLLGLMLRLRMHFKFELITGVLVITLINTCLFEVLLWVVLRKLQSMEERRLAAQALALNEKQRLADVLEQTVAKRTTELAASLVQMRAILESSSDGILSVDVDCCVNFINPAAEKMLGIRAEAASGRTASQLLQITGRDGQAVDPRSGMLGEALRTGKTIKTNSQTFWRLDGTSFPVECIATPIYVMKQQEGLAQELNGAMLTFRDISERLEVDRMKSEFISIVSHELRTPLTSLRGVLGLLVAGKLAELNPHAKQMVELAERNAEKLTNLITSIVDVDRLESGRLKLHQVYTSSSEMVKIIAATALPLGKEAGVTLSYKVTEMPLELDVERVAQVMTILISNAVKYSSRGQTVTISVAKEHEAVHFSVADEGPGIPEEKQAKIFDRFHQGDSSDVRSKGGTGLGLAIARGIVKKHGGKIWLESEVGRGSVFHFTLPQRRKRREEQPLPLGLS